MSRKVRPHGTYAKYVVERCRCEECRDTCRRHARRLNRENTERAWGVRPPILIDATDTREHILLLRAAGIGRLQIEKLSGVGHTAQWKIVTGRVRRVHRETERAIMSVGTTDHVFMRSRMDAAPARAIVAELRQMGFTKTALARALGYKSPALQIPDGERCTLRTMRRLQVLRDLAIRAVAS